MLMVGVGAGAFGSTTGVGGLLGAVEPMSEHPAIMHAVTTAAARARARDGMHRIVTPRHLAGEMLGALRQRLGALGQHPRRLSRSTCRLMAACVTSTPPMSTLAITVNAPGVQ